ncbi:hypothetical protein AVEN_21602-1 [Araneus ventricosus]|uniref:Uncharacterized protein n=1 Tax=Araneus ventricosus TaxID=182803 RepID=A0A4Y2P5W3_ARAVE|nr:hypothetical protein AVEN_21602-1 [Araneus ventricosus]
MKREVVFKISDSYSDSAGLTGRIALSWIPIQVIRIRNLAGRELRPLKRMCPSRSTPQSSGLKNGVWCETCANACLRVLDGCLMDSECVHFLLLKTERVN